MSDKTPFRLSGQSVWAGCEPGLNMAAYWSLFCLPLVFRAFSSIHPILRTYGLVLFALVLVLMIGFRLEVGCDWFNYERNFDEIVSQPWTESIKTYEPGHVFVTLIVYSLGFNVSGTNVIYAAIFVAGFIPFALRQPLPFLTLVLAVPYLITVVAMGYTRQATAIGILFFAIAACENKRVLAVIFWVVVASLFHRTALAFLILVPIARGGRFDLINIAMILCAPVGLAFVQSDVDRYVTNYVEAGMVSDGGFIRLLLTAIAGATFLVLRSHFRRHADYKMFMVFAIAAIASLPLNSVASTAVDRMALYLMPFQIAVFARLSLVFKQQDIRILLVTVTTIVYAVQLYVWLNFATNSYCWIPYHNIMFQSYNNPDGPKKIAL